MAERLSALAGHAEPRRFGAPDTVGVTLSEVPGLVLHQAACWPDTMGAVAEQIAKASGADAAPGPGRAVAGKNGTLLRIEPLKWWILDTPAPALASDEGAVLDLSHSRTRIRLSGPEAATLLNRHLPLDLRTGRFPPGSVGSSAVHHVGVTVWHSDLGYDLFLPRSFALSLWEGLVESAAQFGAEIV
ncbi:MAG: sarcosine oxidase subunit gamma [Pseudomonadota bacterium]